MKSYQLVNFCEVDKFAVKSYCAVHGIDEKLNLGDIKMVAEKERNGNSCLQDFDLMTWGFPCQDISVVGKQKGFVDEQGNQTRSGLYYDGLGILKSKKPKISIIENVKNLTGKKFANIFKQILSDLDEAGYNTYWKVLNAKNYGVLQNRERVFIVSIRKDIDNGLFKFPEPFDSGIRLKDLLDKEVEEKFYLSKTIIDGFERHNKRHKVKGTGFLWKPIDVENSNEVAHCLRASSSLAPTDNTIIEIGSLNPNSHRNREVDRVYDVYGISPFLNTMQGGNRQPKIFEEQKYVDNISDEFNYVKNKTQEMLNKTEISNTAPTLTTCSANPSSSAQVLVKQDNFRIRKLTPREYWRLMGFSDEQFDKAKSAGISNAQLYKQAGNSIVVDVLYYIYKELYKAIPSVFNDLKISSFFSGIGAFESALEKFYKELNSNSESF